MSDTKRIKGVFAAEVGTDWIKLLFGTHDITIDNINVFNKLFYDCKIQNASLQTKNDICVGMLERNTETMMMQISEIEQKEAFIGSQKEEIEKIKKKLNQAEIILKVTSIGLRNGRDFGYLQETEEKDLEAMIKRIDDALFEEGDK